MCSRLSRDRPDRRLDDHRIVGVVAQEIGAYKRAGLDVSFVQPADPTMPPRLVAARHGDIAIDYQPQLYQQVTNGLPLTRIGVLIDKPLSTLTTLRGNGINRIADLRGKRIGYNEVGGPTNLASIATMLSTTGLTMNDVDLLVIGSLGWQFTYSSASRSTKYSAVVFRNSAFRDPARPSRLMPSTFSMSLPNSMNPQTSGSGFSR